MIVTTIFGITIILVYLRIILCSIVSLRFGSWSKKNETSPFDRCLFLEWGLEGLFKMAFLQWHIWTFKKLLDVVKKEYIY